MGKRFDFSEIEPKGETRASILNDSDWIEIHEARKRGYSWSQVFSVVGAFDSWRSLAVSARRAFKRLGLS